MSLCPQLGHSSSAPPSGNSGLGAWKKFTTPEFSIMECVNSKLQLSHRSVQRAIAVPPQPYSQRRSVKYSLHISAAEYAIALFSIEQTPVAWLISHGLGQPAEPFSPQGFP